MAALGGCLIKSLLADPFSDRTFDEQKNIVKAGRPTPALPNLSFSSAKYKRHFQSSAYEKYGWLTGSNDLNALFCWHCLLFSRDRESSWTKTGYINLGNLVAAMQRHEVTIIHLRASLSLSTFYLTIDDVAPDYQLDIKKSLLDQKVRRNREILKRLIDAVCFLSEQDLLLSSHNENDSSARRSYYEELLKYTAKYDVSLADHLENSSMFKGISYQIQRDIVEAWGEIVITAMKKELNEVQFVSVLVDEISGVSTQAQFSIIMRYVYKGEAKERFLGFIYLHKIKNAGAIVEQIRLCLSDFCCNEKLVAQAYSGAPAMADHMNEVQAQIKVTHPFALFVYCHANDLSQVLSKNVTLIPECKIFFSAANGIAAFFSGSIKRTRWLDEFLSLQLPQVRPSQWSSSSQLVSSLHENRFQLKNVFEVMLACPDEIEADFLAPVGGFLSLLEDFQFNFLLKTFDKIFAYTDVFYDSLPDQLSDILYCRKKIDEFQQNIAALRDDFENVYEDTKELVGDPIKSGNKNYERLYSEVIDRVVHQVETLFQDYGKLKFLSLLSSQKFNSYAWSFPDDLFKNLLNTYGKFFDEIRLKNELIALYTSEKFRCKTVPEMATVMYTTDLKDSFPQLHLLVSLLYTIPASFTSNNGYEWTLNKVKKYSQNATLEEQLSYLSLLSTEKDLTTQLKSDDQFYDEIINSLCKNKQHIVDFLHQ